MRLNFLIEYKAAWGQELCVHILTPKALTVPLTCSAEKLWRGHVDLNDAAFSFIEYIYEVKVKNRVIRSEALRFSHKLSLNTNDEEAFVIDSWRNKLNDSFLYTDAFTQKNAELSCPTLKESLNIRALCNLKENSSLFITGSCDTLGNWDPQKGLRLIEVKPNFFTISLNKKDLPQSFEYKFAAINHDTGEIFWEIGSNRIGSFHNANFSEYPQECTVKFYPFSPKLAGTAVPVFSLKSEGSFGVGDFGDLKLFVDWAIKTGQKLVQILPINDTTITKTWTDSYPYNSISIYAFHPMYIDLRQAGKLSDKKLNAKFQKLQVKLNSLERIDYEAVNKAKLEYLHLLYEEQGDKVLASSSFKEFFKLNKSWLIPYAAFSFFRDKYATADFSTWPEAVYDQDAIAALCAENSPNYKKIAFYFYLQYLLHVQLKAVSVYAKDHGIILKGDIPIGISRSSVEAWVEPFYFNMESQAGAPPDPFSADGQNWGFPTYNWDAMAQDGYAWWLKRFKKMSEYFGAYRIDHILGFFRIWDIPSHCVRGLLGNFVPSLPFSVNEIESYGLKFQYDFMTRPFINEELIDRLFGKDAKFVKETFLCHLHHDIFGLKEEFLTERQVKAYFNGKNDERSVKIRNGLYSLISDVLFIPDREHPNLYHPRIGVLDDYIFSRLQPFEKEAFTRLYNDYFYKRHNQFWYDEAMKKLPALINSTPMLTCGEDLGMVPDCVPWVMRDLDILSLEIERMPKDPGNLFNNTDKYPQLSVCTTGTHDMTTLRGWWKEDPSLTQIYFNNVLGHEGKAPQKLSGKLCEEIVLKHLQSPSLLCVLPLQDWLGVDEKLRAPDVLDERINVPAIPRYYWRYRMHLTLEQLLSSKEFNNRISALISASGRN